MTVADDALRKIFKKIHENKMKEIIYKQDVIDALLPLYHEHEYRIPGKAESYSQYNEAWQDALSMVENVIFSLPSAQPERKKGHWIRHITTGLGPKLNDTIECSECRIAFSTENMFRRSFCPNCGADMRGESE